MVNIDLTLLTGLTDKRKPHWGIMTPHHMVEHLLEAVKMSNGKTVFTECVNQPEKFPLLKKILLSSRPFPKDFVNTVIGEGLKPLTLNNLEEAKNKLQTELDDFYKYFKTFPEAEPMNPTFGPLTFDEWSFFHTKHFTHHFTQFGLITQ